MTSTNRLEISDTVTKAQLNKSAASPVRLRIAIGHTWSFDSPSLSAKVLYNHLFNEELRTISRTADWIKAQPTDVDYPVWIPDDVVEPMIDSPASSGPSHICHALGSFAYSSPDLTKPVFRISMGTTIDVTMAREIIAPNGIDRVSLGQDRHGLWFSLVSFMRRDAEIDLAQCVEKFVGVPYLYHGRTSEGIDAYGLLQIACKVADVVIASSIDEVKVSVGTDMGPLSTVAPKRGDLVFFGDTAGVFIDERTVVYASEHDVSVVRVVLQDLLRSRGLSHEHVLVRRISRVQRDDHHPIER